MIENDEGQVAVKYLQSVPHVIYIDGVGYAFVVRRTVCMAWIAPEHVEKILEVRTKSCCDGSKKKKYLLANELDVQRWS